MKLPKLYTIAAVAKELGISRQAFCQRLTAGLQVEMFEVVGGGYRVVTETEVKRLKKLIVPGQRK